MDETRDQNEAFLKLTKLLATDLDLNSVLKSILETDAANLHVNRASIWLYDASEQGIELVDLFEASSGDHKKGIFLHKDAYPSYFEAVDSSRVLRIDDVSTHHATAELLEGYLKPLGITSMLDVPIIIRGRLRGMLCHEHIGPWRKWSLSESSFAASMADLVGQAIQTHELRDTENRLKASEERAQLLFSNNPVALLVVDEEGHIRSANQRAMALFHAGPGELENLKVEDLIPARLRPNHVQQRASYQRAPTHRPLVSTRELFAKDLDNSEFPAEIGLCPVQMGGTTHVICAVTDISERKQAERRLRVLSTALEQSPATMMILDAEGKIDYVNPYYSQITGFQESHILGQTLDSLCSAQNSPEIIHNLKVAIRQGQPWAGELSTLTRTGEIIWEDAHVAPVRDDQQNVSHFVAMKLNITHRKQDEALLRHLALHDHLTDLPNRILLSDRLAMSMESARRNSHQMALMFVDLDHFKEINDVHGHDVGDEVLKASAQRMREQLRGMDTVARVGGDEFVLLIPSVKLPRDALSVAEKIRQAIRAPIPTSVREMRITCSIGIALYPQQASNEIELYRNADLALYRVKAAGRDAVQLY